MKSVLPLVGLSLLLTACDTLSLQPLHSEKDKSIAEPALLDRWIHQRRQHHLESHRNGAGCLLCRRGREERRSARGTSHPYRPSLICGFSAGRAATFQIPGHFFGRVRVDGPKIRIAWVDFKWLARQIRPQSFPPTSLWFLVLTITSYSPRRRLSCEVIWRKYPEYRRHFNRRRSFSA